MSVKTGVTQENKESSAFDLAVVLLEAVAIAIVIRIFLFQPFNIPSGSMIPTLLVGDYLFVSKYSYGYSRYSFPFGLDLFSGRILASEPNRGDVIVFKTPTDNSTDYIKRLVGLPGDKIQMIGGVLNINGVPVKRERVEDKIEDTKCGPHMAVHVYRETLPDGRSYLTQKLSETCAMSRLGAADNTEVFVVPPKHYFMMGDNRDDSADSRFSVGNGVGYVPEENLVGRARILFFSIDEADASWFAPWRWPLEIRWSRIGNVIR
jgi:signal peptidase I